ncbi:styrene monooxygenase/indole monooxygenase family protein [Novosphingobium rosa]|uniref:styrene monooxygenase/indole monooxygenase family protein n=1 Tax=Novosphingobium rosa TaxID=76978 RepID=UPI00082D092C|nr:styrene monooxygenase/indole monooxygenase family protein [Novosphingobium rosa]
MTGIGTRIGIVGAGQAGLQLGMGLLAMGYEVVMLSNLTGEQIAAGRVTSSQCMFNTARTHERALGLNFWDAACPPVEGIGFSLAGPEQQKLMDWAARLDAPAQSVDQRLKMPRWLDEFEKRGGELRIVDAGIAELEELARECDLVLVASGKGEIGRLFERDAEKSPFDKPMRSLALTYVQGMHPREAYSAVNFNLIPGVGEYFVFPALTLNGPCEIMVFEAIPGGPMDLWNPTASPEEHLEISLHILKRHVPWEYERSRDCRLTDDLGVLCGRFPPTVRKPVLTLPSGAKALGVGDAVCLNDPITGQGANNAAKCAASYLVSILANEGQSFDAAWMQQTFDRYWDYARDVVAWTNGMLMPPPPHMVELLGAACVQPRVAHWFANNFDDPRRFFPTIGDPALTAHFLTEAA